MISVDLNIKTPKFQEKSITSRDVKKLRRNPDFFLNILRNVGWEIFIDMEDVDPMEEFWTKEINKCTDIVAPWKSRKVRKKRLDLGSHIFSSKCDLLLCKSEVGMWVTEMVTVSVLDILSNFHQGWSQVLIGITDNYFGMSLKPGKCS